MSRIAVITLLMGIVTTAAASEGERLAYVVGCINCHHQTPKEIINAPPLAIVQAYSPEQFRRLLRSGVTLSGRDLPAIGSIMGIIAVESFDHMTDEEIAAIYRFLREDWNDERAAFEEAKIETLYGAKMKAHAEQQAAETPE